MASQMPLTDTGGAAPAIHEDKELCQYLLNSITTTTTLQILPSGIHRHGTGLFAKEAIPEGADIFRSQPLINCVSNEHSNFVCDNCLTSSTSNIHPTGHFRGIGDTMPQISQCAGCRVCGYCSKKCQKEAWRRYHKLECKALKSTPTAYERTRALFRLLVLHKHNGLAEQEWRTANSLLSHQPQQYPGHGAQTSLNVAINAKVLELTDLNIQTIQNLYCMILTNSMSIHQPNQNTIGTTLDLVGSLVSHSCDPNAFAFFEQSQLRVRSLRPIKAGEEITQTYVDSKASVMMRQKIIKSDYFFTCECSRCQEELRDYQTRASKENIPAHVFAETENDILQYLNQVVEDYNTSRTGTALEQIESKLSLLTTRVFPKQDWPDTLWPMSDGKMTLATLYRDNGNHLKAVIYALKGSLGFTRRSGPNWDYTLFELLQFIALVVVPEQRRISAKDSSFPRDRQLWDFFHGLLHQLLTQSRKTFGFDTAYTKAIATWYTEAISSADRPLPGEKGFSKRFDKAQSVVLSWAGIDMSRKIVLAK